MTITFIAIQAILITMLVFDTGYQSGKQKLESSKNITIKEKEAIELIETECSKKTTQEQANCITNILERKREYQISEQTLKLQFNAVKWSFWSLIVATISGAISMVGIYYVYQTLLSANKNNEATLKAVEIANESNEISKSQNRPWLTIKHDTTCEFINEDRSNFYFLFWQFKIINKGKMPAHDIKIVWNVYKYDWSYLGAGIQGVEDTIKRSKIKTNNTIQIIFPDEEIPRWQYASGTIYGENDGHIFLCITISYSLDPLGKKKAYTSQSMIFEGDKEQLGPLKYKLKRIDSDHYTQIT